MKFEARKIKHKSGAEIKGSSAIRDIDYNARLKILTVTFIGGNSARYRDVPQGIVTGFTNAASAGSYFNTYIKPSYQQI